MPDHILYVSVSNRTQNEAARRISEEFGYSEDKETMSKSRCRDIGRQISFCPQRSKNRDESAG